MAENVPYLNKHVICLKNIGCCCIVVQYDLFTLQTLFLSNIVSEETKILLAVKIIKLPKSFHNVTKFLQTSLHGNFVFENTRRT